MEITLEPSWAGAAELAERLRDFNEREVGPRNTLAFMLSARDKTGSLVAGLTGETFWNALYVHVLWVAADHRKNGYGTELVSRAEDVARQRGCDISLLSTFSFQAPGFYEKLGYGIFGELTDLPRGHRRLWLAKRLAPNRP